MEFTKIKSILISLLLITLSQNAYADDFNIKLSSPPAKDMVVLNIEMVFEQPTTIYHWLSRKTIYPILNRGLYVECHNHENGEKVYFMAQQQALPKVPHKLDTLKVTKYTEELVLIPGKDYVVSKLNKGKYSLKLIYNPKKLKIYPGGKGLSTVQIESNEITFEVKI